MAGQKKTKYTAEQFIKALDETGGIISLIASKIGCDWHTARKYIDNHPSVRQAYDSECEKVLDLAESKLIKAMRNDDGRMIRFFLGTKGRHRGYVTRQELGGEDGGALPIRIIEVVKHYESGEKDAGDNEP